MKSRKIQFAFAIQILALVSSALAATHYVDLNSANPLPPYTNWGTAAISIQDAVNVSTTNEVVMVANGVYASCVTVTNPLVLLSVNGPQVTIIDGGLTNRCVSLTDGAILTGFTLTNGRDIAGIGGGGVWCSSTNVFLTNCVIVHNATESGGGGAYGGTLNNCLLSGNVSQGQLVAGGGAYGAILYKCTLTDNSAYQGGGACGCTLFNCSLNGNFALGYEAWGGGVASCTLYNCTLAGNSAVGDYAVGGGAYGGYLYNCTVTGNSASNAGGTYWSVLFNCTLVGNSSGVHGGPLYNCIVLYNGQNYDKASALNFCCSDPVPTNGIGNIDTDPLFVEYDHGNLRLQSNSPCINAGTNSYVVTTTDLDGRQRVVGGTVDMGAYEFQPDVNGAFIGWLQQFGLPTDGSADFTDTDLDGLNNWQEWVCNTCPTNLFSVLRLLSVIPQGTDVAVTWKSVAGVNYFLECSTNLAASSCFTCVVTNFPGRPGYTRYVHTNAPSAGALYYRVGVGK